MIYTVYILESEQTGRYYIGQTQDMDQRLEKHNSGKVISTQRHVPWRLIYVEVFETRSEAVRREAEIKGFKSRKRIEDLVAQLVPKNKNSSNS